MKSPTHFQKDSLPKPDKKLDAVGLICPEPVMLLHNAVRDAETGQVIEVKATDPSTLRDIPKFCEFLGHQLLIQIEENELLVFYIQKG